jgi:glycerol uptake facilitator-like aquaporin
VRSSKYLAEFLGTGILVAVVVGSGAMATNLSGDRGIELLINTIATVLGLGILITIFAPISGSHFNPVVTLAEFAMKRLSLLTSLGYVIVQLLGGVAGAVIANLMFKHPAMYMSKHIRSGSNLFLGEVVATAGLLLIIHLIGYQKRSQLAPILVATWIGSAYFFTSSTSFANPAVTFGRAFSNTFAGIAMRSVPAFIFAQILGAAIGFGIAFVLSYEMKERKLS